MRSNDESMALTVGEATMHEFLEAMTLLKSAPPASFSGSQRIWADDAHPAVRRPRPAARRAAATRTAPERAPARLAGARHGYWLLLLACCSAMALLV